MCRFFSCRGAAVAVLFVCAAWATAAHAETIPLGSEAAKYASLRGRVYVDLNASGQLDAGEGLIPNVKILLEGITGTSEPFSATAWTDAQGSYLFKNLPSGVYSITETQPVQFLQGKSPRVLLLANGSAVDADRYAGIALSPGTAAASYDFRESGLRSAYLSKRYLLTYQPKPPASIPEPAAALALATAVAAILAMRGRRPNA